MRHTLLTVSLAGALASGPLSLNLDRAEAMIAATGLGRGGETLSLIEKAGCWRYGWHGWGWYPRCGWGWHRGWGWHGWGWHRGWHRW